MSMVHGIQMWNMNIYKYKLDMSNSELGTNEGK